MCHRRDAYAYDSGYNTIYTANGDGPSLGGTITDGDAYGVAVDIANRNMWVRRNAGNWNGSGAANPATNAGGTIATVTPASARLFKAQLFPMHYCSGGAQVVANFGGSTFAHAAPTGFTPWG
jgi:hypothetical protein